MKAFSLLLLLISCIAFAQSPVVIQTDSEKGLVPEGIAVDKRTGKIYVSSIAKQKIIVFDETGKTKDFISTGSEGYLEGLGMSIDTVRNMLWTVSNHREGNIFHSRVMGCDLVTAKKQFELEEKDTIPRLYNDVIIDRNGDLLLTDTYFSTVLRIDPERRSIDTVSVREFRWPNGITRSPANQLYIATYGNGPMRMDMKTNKIFQLNGYSDSLIAHGLDGLYWYKNSLIGIYNTAPDNSGNAIIQYHLSATGDSIVSEGILAKGHPLFRDPTTAALVGDTLYVLANSNLDTYNKNKESIKGIESQLGPVVILKFTLE